MKVTVKDVLALLPNTKDIYLVWDGSVVQRSPFSVLDMDAYGDYAVGSICPGEEKSIEIVLAAQPVKVSRIKVAHSMNNMHK
ncbi:hypothetical protein [Pseudoflavonifractor phocaeensis]|uniref:hypothetical protein n=1 Tax=Pseudoflavonifractor phocaeensis TaxID=1870988 RepID=UPI00195BFE6B|nr:hypothetical protein [Pseudoflavonifractor phocaeensis]MBM6721939.1 hypothetical protein [Pseudoflavonifractor phocaeensis]